MHSGSTHHCTLAFDAEIRDGWGLGRRSPFTRIACLRAVQDFGKIDVCHNLTDTGGSTNLGSTAERALSCRWYVLPTSKRGHCRLALCDHVARTIDEVSAVPT